MDKPPEYVEVVNTKACPKCKALPGIECMVHIDQGTVFGFSSGVVLGLHRERYDEVYAKTQREMEDRLLMFMGSPKDDANAP